jgi:hypothetical protein
MTRRENHGQHGHGMSQFGPRGQQQGFFPFKRAAANQHPGIGGKIFFERF